MRRISLVLGMALVGLSGCQTERVETQVAFADLPSEEQHSQLMANIETAKVQLIDKEEYTCCIKPTCNWCLLYEKHCGCAKRLVEGKNVCPECGHGWKVGRGNIPGIDPADVKSGVEEHERGHELEDEAEKGT